MNTSVPAGFLLFPDLGGGLPSGSGLGLSRCLGPGECLLLVLLLLVIIIIGWLVSRSR